MTEKFENDYDREIEKLRKENALLVKLNDSFPLEIVKLEDEKAVLLEACKLSLEKLSYYTDEYKGGPHIGVVRKSLRNAISQAKRKGG